MNKTYQISFFRHRNAAKSKFGGFTLIELLVVVLIIGILAGIALPQYQKAVFKTRSAEALVLYNAVVRAVDIYMMSNSSFPEDIKDLEIGIPVPESYENGKTSAFCSKGTTDGGVDYAYCVVNFFGNSRDFVRLVYNKQREKICYARGHSATDSSELAVHFCQSVGELKSTSSDWDTYIMY